MLYENKGIDQQDLFLSTGNEGGEKNLQILDICVSWEILRLNSDLLRAD